MMATHCISAGSGERSAMEFNHQPREYVSIFKVNGVAIIGPLMTKEKYKEMKNYKQRALELERVLLARRDKKLDTSIRRKEKMNEILMTPVLEKSLDCVENVRISEDCVVSELDENNGAIMKLEKSLTRRCQQQDVSALENVYKIGSENEEDKTNSEFTKNLSRYNDNTEKSYQSQLNELQEDFDALNQAIFARINKEEIKKHVETDKHNMCRENQTTKVCASDEANESDPKRSLFSSAVKNMPNEKVIISTTQQQQPLTNLNSREKLKSLALPIKELAAPEICIYPPTPLKETTPSDLVTTTTTSSACSVSMHTSMSKNDTKELNSRTPTSTNSRDSLIFESSLCLEIEIPKPPRRSATSPQLSCLAASGTPTALNADSSCESLKTSTPLVRSNSFTLACPSKALLEHIRQQQAPCRRNSCRRNLPSPSTIRDTVESKAKRVQKFDNSNSKNNKNSRPQSVPRVQVQQQSLPKDNVPSTKQRAAITVKTGKNCNKDTMQKIKAMQRHLKTAPKTKNALSLNQVPAGIKDEQRQKFVDLLIKQRVEQQQLQQLFAAQQKRLLEELTAEMCKSKLKASVPTTPTKTQTFSITSSNLQSSTTTTITSPSSSNIHVTTVSSPLSGSASNFSTKISTTAKQNRGTSRRRLIMNEQISLPLDAPVVVGLKGTKQRAQDIVKFKLY